MPMKQSLFLFLAFAPLCTAAWAQMPNIDELDAQGKKAIYDYQLCLGVNAHRYVPGHDLRGLMATCDDAAFLQACRQSGGGESECGTASAMLAEHWLEKDVR
jgi:hypothetical protein